MNLRGVAVLCVDLAGVGQQAGLPELVQDEAECDIGSDAHAVRRLSLPPQPHVLQQATQRHRRIHTTGEHLNTPPDHTHTLFLSCLSIIHVHLFN